MTDRDKWGHAPDSCKSCREQVTELNPRTGAPFSRCQTCRSARNSAEVARRKRLRELGICASASPCSRKAVPGKAMCREHLKYSVAANSLYRSRKSDADADRLGD